jgi:hypothetical protein
MFPCTGTQKPAAKQVSDMIAGLKDVKYNAIWIDIETNSSPNCGWTKDYTFNCQFTS